MISFNVINYDFNRGKTIHYDVVPYLIECYRKSKVKPETIEDLKAFIERTSMCQWGYRCEYEIIIKDWPGECNSEKWDIHKQVMMNIDVITKIIYDIVNK